MIRKARHWTAGPVSENQQQKAPTPKHKDDRQVRILLRSFQFSLVFPLSSPGFLHPLCSTTRLLLSARLLFQNPTKRYMESLRSATVAPKDTNFVLFCLL